MSTVFLGGHIQIFTADNENITKNMAWLSSQFINLLKSSSFFTYHQA